MLPKSVPTRPDWASGSGAPPFPQPNSVNQHSIDAVALGGARALACADTAVDSRPQHTAARAALAGWLTPTYGRAQLSVAMVVPPGARWDDWLRHRAYVVVTARLGGDDHPADTSTAAARMVALTEQAIGRDGWHDKPMSAVVAVVLKQMKGVWRIDDDQPS